MPSEIGAVRPRSSRAREFRAVEVFLPQRRGRAARIDSALLTLTPTAREPNGYRLDLRGGECEISTRTWLRGDYRGVFEAGARSGFAETGPERVDFTGLDLTLERGDLHARLRQASGSVTFGPGDVGEAQAFCTDFNGVVGAQPVVLRTRFSGVSGGVRVDSLQIEAPPLPLEIVGLSAIGSGAVCSGQFDGLVEYRESGGGRELLARGHCRDLDLAEWSQPLIGRSWRGRCPEIELQELRVRDGMPAALGFRGILDGVSLGDVLATWGIEGVGGDARLRVLEAQLSPGGISRLVFAGECAQVSLEKLTAALGWGRMSGVLAISIRDLTIEDNRIRSLNAEVRVERTGDAPNWIEGALLREAARRLIKINLPPILPERIEFSQFGVKLEIRDELLHVFGSHGPREKTILTVRLFDQDLPLVFEPERSFDLRPVLDQLRAEAHRRLERFRSTTRPAGPPSQ